MIYRQAYKRHIMAKSNDKTYTSPPSEPDDEIWLEQGRLMLTESLSTVRDAANALIFGLSVLEGIYVGMLGFADFIPANLAFGLNVLFFTPLLLWLFALYFCIVVVMTQRLEINLHSPSDIREKSTSLLLEKQRYLMWAFWLLAIGLLSAFGLLIFRLRI
jgi:ABC-type amino acid transport system permease subunit